MKQLIAKTKVASVTDFGNNNKDAKLSAVTSGSDENKSFSAYTPRLDLSILINNPENINFFEPGEEIYLMFSDEKLPDALKILELLKSAFMIGYSTHKNSNTFKVIGWELEKNGFKTFLTDDGKVIDMQFLESQLQGKELEMFKECSVGETCQRVFKGGRYSATRLT